MNGFYFCLSRVFSFIGAWGLLLTGLLSAECEINWEDRCEKNSYFQIGASYTRVNLRIPGFSSFDGNLGGIQGSYEYMPKDSLYAGLRAAWKQGKTENSDADRRLIYIDVQERLGYTFASCCQDWSMTLFTGLGYRFLGHKLKQCEEPSIKFEYNEFYIPVGFLSEYRFCSCWSVGFNFVWMPQIYPTVEIKPLQGARWCLQEKLSNFLVEVPLTYDLTGDSCYMVILKPFYERWEDGRSTAKTFSGQELGLPKNAYNFGGIELNFALYF